MGRDVTSQWTATTDRCISDVRPTRDLHRHGSAFGSEKPRINRTSSGLSNDLYIHVLAAERFVVAYTSFRGHSSSLKTDHHAGRFPINSSSTVGHRNPLYVVNVMLWDCVNIQ